MSEVQFLLAGFQATIIGLFWVTAEAQQIIATTATSTSGISA
jgi:hypothetical protein